MRITTQIGMIAAGGLIAAIGVGFILFQWRRPSGGIGLGEARLIRTAIEMNAEITELGRIAGIEADSEDVRDFAQMLVEDHSQELTDLEGIASYLGVPVLALPSRKGTRLAEKLKSMHGKAIDLAYMQAMLDMHEHNVALFRRIAETGKVAEVKAFAGQCVTRLEKHLAEAKRIADGLTPHYGLNHAYSPLS